FGLYATTGRVVSFLAPALFTTSIALATPLVEPGAAQRYGILGILLVLLIAPFFSSFILRTQAWKQILADEGFVAQSLKALALLPP
ncbi:hypothetical protein KZ309_25945, partial [Escherichia coli]|nr:hypothetical protein [Escherichia coli]